MHTFDDWLPGFHLVLGPYTWSAGIPLGTLRDPSGLTDQEAAFRSPLGVVEGDMLARKVVVAP
jgi:hypothetical protein